MSQDCKNSELQQEYVLGLKRALTIVRLLRTEQASGDYTSRAALQDAIDRINVVIHKAEAGEYHD